MVILVVHVWNIHFNLPIPVIGVPCAMPPKVIGSGKGVMGPTKPILYVDMDRIAPASNNIGSRFI